jgi:hypothetical protein
MKICLITAFPPSKVVLNEYGYHVARELQADPLVSLTILADELQDKLPELPEFNVERCWTGSATIGAFSPLFATSALTLCGSTWSFPASEPRRVHSPRFPG